MLGVAASDSRGRSPTVHILLRAGLRVLASGETALGGVAGPDDVVSAPVVALPRRQVVAVTRGNALDRLFDDNGYSRVAGGAVLLPSGPTTPEAVREFASAGARAVLVDGPIPAGSLGIDEPIEVPIVGVSAGVAAEVRRSLAAGVPVDLGVGAAAFGSNPELDAVAPFSSTGLSLDGGAGAELTAPGVGLVTAVPGRNEGGAARYGTLSGSSAAAAIVAGSAALLAQARPDLDAAGLRSALVATSRPLPGTRARASSTQPPRRRSRSSPIHRSPRSEHSWASDRVPRATCCCATSAGGRSSWSCAPVSAAGVTVRACPVAWCSNRGARSESS